jgi:hypothetical protein
MVAPGEAASRSVAAPVGEHEGQAEQVFELVKEVVVFVVGRQDAAGGLAQPLVKAVRNRRLVPLEAGQLRHCPAVKDTPAACGHGEWYVG